MELVLDMKGGHSAIIRVVLPGTGSPDCPMGSCATIDAVADSIKAFLEGEDRRFPLALVDLKSCPAFQQSVLRLTCRIPRGRVSTYHAIAVKLGRPQGARAVGQALATNPFPLMSPCHRVIRSDGQPGGYLGGCDMKRALLGMEGVHGPLLNRGSGRWQ